MRYADKENIIDYIRSTGITSSNESYGNGWIHTGHSFMRWEAMLYRFGKVEQEYWMGAYAGCPNIAIVRMRHWLAAD